MISRKSRVCQRHAAQNLATLLLFCLNVLRQDQQHKVGVRAKQKVTGWSPQYLLSLLAFTVVLETGGLDVHRARGIPFRQDLRYKCPS